MKLNKKHIGYLFLTSEKFQKNIIEAKYPGLLEKTIHSDEEKVVIKELTFALNSDKQKAFYVTNSVINNLNLLKVKKKNNCYDWTVFNHLKTLKYTFLYQPLSNKKGSGCLRMAIDETRPNSIEFVYIYEELEDNDNSGIFITLFGIDTITNEPLGIGNDYKGIEEQVYKLLCFVFLSENEEEIIKPNERKGTRKNSKIVNEFPIPITIINSKWNVTSIRTEGFPVSGHFAIRWTGEGRQVAKLVLIQPFEKHGYIRKAAKPE